MKRFALALGLVSFAAAAYIPSSGAMMRRAAARVQEGGKAREVTLVGSLAVEGGAPAAAQLVLRFPLSCKLEQHGAPAISSAEGPAGPARDLVTLACPFIAYRGQSMAEAERTLRTATSAAGVDVAAATGITRLIDRAVYILGADPHQPSKPQLWLYKDNNAPARLLTQKGAELRLLQYGNPAAGDWFPRTLELWQNGALAARFETLEVKGFRDAAEDEDQDDARE